MNNIEIYLEQKSKAIRFTLFTLAFWLPAMVIREYKPELSGWIVDPGLCALILQAVGLYFIIQAYRYSKCPTCKKYAGNIFLTNKCKHCDEQLT